MKKIPTLFLRGFSGDPSRVTREVHPDCRWAFDGYDGLMLKRYDAKGGKMPPCITRTWSGSPSGLPLIFGPISSYVRSCKRSVRAFAASLCHLSSGPAPTGTHPAQCPVFSSGAIAGRKLNGEQIFADAPHTFDGLARWLETQAIEGVVFTFGSLMCKIKRSDFGHSWPL